METSTQGNGSGVLMLAAPPAPHPDRVAPITEGTARLLGAAAILGIGVIHILDAASTYHSTRWIFWAYMALIVAAVPVTLFLLHSASPLGWAVAASLAAGPLVAYLWSRSIGLPGDAPDVGNWLCTLGMAALFVETSLLGLSLTRFAMGRRSR